MNWLTRPFDARGVAPHHLKIVVGSGGGFEEVDNHVNEVECDPGRVLIGVAAEAVHVHLAGDLLDTSWPTDLICRSDVP